MALTVTINKRTVIGDRRSVVADVDFDSSYPTGGESLSAADLGLKKVELVLASPNSGFSFEYDYTNSKLKAMCPGVVTTAAGAGTLDDFPLSGTGATSASIGLTAGNTTTRFGGQVEVANTVDLSGITDVRVFAIGY